MGEHGVSLSETTSLTYLGRLLDTLELVVHRQPPSTFREAARALGVPPSTAHRLLSFLIEREYCERAGEGRFGPGPRLFSIGVRALEQLPQWQVARKIVAELGEVTGESASFGLLVGDEIVITARWNSPEALAAVANVGDLLSPHASALGKAVLASATPAKRRRIVENFAPGAADEILRALSDELDQVAKVGYSVDEEAFSPGIRCRAVAVLDSARGLLGGLSVSGPTARFTASRAESTIPMLQDAAARLLLPTANTPTPSAGARQRTTLRPRPKSEKSAPNRRR